MDFLSSLHTDVKLLLAGGALALLAALVSGSKTKEYQYMAVFAVLMAAAGVRYNQQQAQDLAEAERRTDHALNQPGSGGGARRVQAR